MKTIILFSALIFFTTACDFSIEDPLDKNYETFTINEGEHYCNQRTLETLKNPLLRFEARFDESAIYEFEDAGFQDSKNKLMGFTDCNSLHHDNSARFGWQWYNNQIEIFAYCYRNGERVEQFLGAVMPGETERYELEISSEFFVFRFKGKETKIERGLTCTEGGYAMLWPYFGGQLPAPHNIQIFIKRV